MKTVEGSVSTSWLGVMFILSIATVVLAYIYCFGPPVFPDSCIATRTGGKYTATLHLTNISFKNVASGAVQVQVYNLVPMPHFENRSYNFIAVIGPLDSGTVEAHAADNIGYYDFKWPIEARSTNCEVEMIRFTDGSHWEMPSPL